MTGPLARPPFAIRHELPGWALYWAELERSDGDEAALSEVRRETVLRVRDRLQLPALAAEPATAALRRLFRAAGCDPTRYRPSSEALLRRLLKGGELPAIHPLVDLNNCLSALCRVPCCVMAEGSWRPPVVLRAGRGDESYDSLKGPFRLGGKPLLADPDGPLDTPITGSRRVMMQPGTTRAWLVAYLPAGVVRGDEAWEHLERLCRRAGVAAERFT